MCTRAVRIWLSCGNKGLQGVMDEQPQVVIHSKFKRCCMCGTDTLEHTARGDGQAVAEAAEKRPQGARWHKAIVYTFGQQIPKDV